MKFDCGESWREKVKRLEQWHSFFAIFPRRVGEHDCRWLEWIERKGKLFCYEGCWWEWEYRAKS